MRAVLAARAAMGAAGYVQERMAKSPEGWIRPNYLNSLAYGVRPLADGRIEWHVHLAGEGHMRWRTYEQRRGDEDDGETDELHEPVDPDRLHAPIRAVFEGLGLAVAEVRTAGWQGMWDKEVSYAVVTAHPDWLESYDPANAPQKAPGPVLTGFALRPDRRGETPVRGALPGYDIGGDPHLTRESVEVLEKATAGSWGMSYALKPDGTLEASRDGRRISSFAPVSHTNHWGDVVEVWPVPPMNFSPAALDAPAAPFLIDGEMRREAPFALFDAQYGEAPWAPAVAGPRP